MIVVDVLIVLFWLFLLTDSYFQGRELPGLMSKAELPELPIPLSIIAILVVSILASVMTFWQRKHIMEDLPLVSKWLDQMLGIGAYRRITHRLRPVSASILTSLMFAVVGIYTTYTETQDSWSYAICIGFLVFATFMFIAYLGSRRFPPVLR